MKVRRRDDVGGEERRWLNGMRKWSPPRGVAGRYVVTYEGTFAS